MRVKSSGMARGLANARSPGSAKFPSGGKLGAGGIELTDALL